AIAAALAMGILCPHMLKAMEEDADFFSCKNMRAYAFSGAFYGGLVGSMMHWLSKDTMSSSLSRSVTSHALCTMAAILILWPKIDKSQRDTEESSKQMTLSDSLLELSQTGAMFAFGGLLGAA